MKNIALLPPIFAFFGMNLLPTEAVQAASAPPDSVLICLPFDFEQWERDHPNRPAGKRLADVNPAEPRTVRMIYFLPNDRPFQPEVVDATKTEILRTRRLFLNQMKAHGHGDLTFRFETDDNGDPLVHRVDGKHPESHYTANTVGAVFEEIGQTFGESGQVVHLIVVDTSKGIDGRVAGVGARTGKNSGFAFITSTAHVFIGHELGHAFGLDHDFRDGAFVMSYGPGLNRLSGCSAGKLAVHSYFNPKIPLEETQPPTIEIMSPSAYQAGSKSVPVRLGLGDSDGLQQVFLSVITRKPHPASGSLEVKACRIFGGEKEAVVEFDYDRTIPSNSLTDLSDPVVHPIYLKALDVKGDVGYANFDLVEISPYQIGTFEGHMAGVHSVSFFPKGKTLVSGAGDEVKLWDVETQAEVGALPGGSFMSLSPDGTTLAAGKDWVIDLWEIATGSHIAALEGHRDRITSLSFSPDGKTLASASYDETVKLWDVESGTLISTFRGHSKVVFSQAFSPDGKILASGSLDGVVKLWDVEMEVEIATLEPHRSWVLALMFSPDGSTLASGTVEGTVRLWDVATETNTTAIKENRGGVSSLAFSPDGETLAFGSRDKTVKLWGVLAKEIIASFAHTAPVSSVALSPDGATLASGSGGTVRLWNVSKWTLRPQMLVKISGDNQQGMPGGVMSAPLVVEVRAQNDHPLLGIEVTFEVTAGDGKLSNRFTIEKTSTGANGRAESILTLGPDTGTNTVEVSSEGLASVTFNAIGIGTPALEISEGGPRIWNLPEKATVRLGKGAIGRGDRPVVFSPDGQFLAVATGIGIWLYDVPASHPLALLPSETGVTSIAFSPEGTTIASGIEGFARIELWDVATGTQSADLAGHENIANSVAFSPDGKTLASGSDDSTVRLWDRDTGMNSVTFEGHANKVSSVAFSPDGATVASGSHDERIILWNIESKTRTILSGHTDRVESVVFSPDGLLLASAAGGTVKLWDVSTGRNTATFSGHTDRVNSVSFSIDGSILASGSDDNTVQLCEAATGRNLTTLGGHRSKVRWVAFSPRGMDLASGSEDGTVNLWDVPTGNAVATLRHGGASHFVTFLSDGTTLAYEAGNTVRLWDLAMARESSIHKGGMPVAFSPDGTSLAFGAGNEIQVRDMATRQNTATLSGHLESVTSVVFSPDGTTLASGSDDATVKLWDLVSGTIARTFFGHTRWVHSVAFSPDGKTLASGSDDTTVKLWEAGTGENTATLEGHTYGVITLAFSPDGKTLASGSSDATVRLWNVASGTNIGTLEGHTRWVGSVAFSPDGKTLASGSGDRMVRLWDSAAGRDIGILSGHSKWVNSVAFSSDGLNLASASQDGTVLLWDMQLALPRPLTLTKLSGDRQQGLPDSTLAQPFEVSVSDQNGNPLAGATVTFAAAAGGGTLSTTTATTDDNGRAGTTLTLGDEPGRNTVVARVGDLKPVIFSATAQAVPTGMAKVSGDEQEAAAGAALSEPLVVVVRDQNNNPLAGAEVTFAVTSGGGTLSAPTATTDENGRAAGTLTLGLPGINTVIVSVAGLDPVTFTATAEATPDFDGDGETGFSDFFLLADAFGSSDPRFDLDGSGTVDFSDFFLFADHFADPARGKLLALAREMIGLPDGPQLQQNAPNPFNSETVISWFLLRPGSARVEVFTLTGQRVAVLHQGPEKAGLHRVHWDGRDDRGRPLASGVYLYRLVTAGNVLTRKLTLLQ